ncbi:MAG: hypothetical protein U0Y96_12445 [Candidatus Kapaibacterium sp.]
MYKFIQEITEDSFSTMHTAQNYTTILNTKHSIAFGANDVVVSMPVALPCFPNTWFILPQSAEFERER